MVRDRLGVSERWACRVVGQHRSSERYQPTGARDDAALRAELRVFSAARPRWGCRQAHHHLLEQGWEVNRKRVQRLWREEGLRVPKRARKRRRLGEGTVPAGRLRAQRPNEVWAFDFQFDQTEDGRAIKLCNIVDEFTREALVMLVECSIDADRVIGELERLVSERGAPVHLRMDNGPEMTAHALKDWCEYSRTGTVYIDPGAPWQNPFVESFHSRVRDELLNVEQFACLAEARVLIEDWREDYNANRPHSALGCAPRPCSPLRGPRPRTSPRSPPDRSPPGGAWPGAPRGSTSAAVSRVRPGGPLLCRAFTHTSHPRWTEKMVCARSVIRSVIRAGRGVR
jgi:putative transposase